MDAKALIVGVMIWLACAAAAVIIAFTTDLNSPWTGWLGFVAGLVGVIGGQTAYAKISRRV